MTAPDVEPPGPIGREPELARMAAALDVVQAGAVRVLAVLGEPGIGKSRLLGSLRELAADRGLPVLAGRAAEFERDLPFGVLVDALDDYLAALPPQRMQGVDPELATVFGGLSGLTAEPPALAAERYRTYRALLQLLERLTVPGPIVLMLDDLHWADPATVEFVGALLRRPPRARLLLAITCRAGQLPPDLTVGPGDAIVERLDVGPLDAEAAARLVGADVPAAVRRQLYRESGGNPFYLEQLARHVHTAPADVVPPAVGEVLARELSSLSPAGRSLLEGAAVAGEPFDPELAAAAAQLDEAVALEALDELLARGLARPTDIPRRFAFRHPLVRRAVYQRAGGGWRLGAHARLASVLEQRGAPAAARAHHVEFSASPGDLAAVELLRTAGEAAAAQAPATAARWFEAALRLLPADANDARLALLRLRGEAEWAAGSLEESRRAILEAIALAPAGAARIELVAACAAAEHWLGRHDDARRRLNEALAELDDPSSREAAVLHVGLAFDALHGLDLARSQASATAALAVAEAIGDRALAAAAGALLALVHATAGRAAEADARRGAALGVVDTLSDAELATRLDALWYLAWSESFLDRYEDALAHASRALELSRATGQGRLVVPLMLATVFPLEMLGRVEEAVEAAAAATEAARLSGNPHLTFWALWEYTVALQHRGDLRGARAAGEESQAIAHDLGRNVLWESEPGWALGGVLAADGVGVRGTALMLESCGGPDVPLVIVPERCIAWEMLTESAIAHGDLIAAEAYAVRAERHVATGGRPLDRVLALRSRAAVQLASGDAAAAAATALASVAAAAGTGARLDGERSRILAGRALAGAGDRDGAVRELRIAEERLHAFGTARYREFAARELRRLGHRVQRAGRGGAGELSDRERAVARLVAEGRTNQQIADELVITRKTVEAHLRSVFRKLGVTSRAAVAARVTRDESR